MQPATRPGAARSASQQTKLLTIRVRAPKGLTIEFADPPAQSKPSLCNAKAILHEFSDGGVTTHTFAISRIVVFSAAHLSHEGHESPCSKSGCARGDTVLDIRP
jgi:hypothetical protein